MAEYIDATILKRKLDAWRIAPNYVYKALNDTPTADVIEREKIDKAIEEIHSYKHGNGNMFDCGMWKAIEILKRNIGE